MSNARRRGYNISNRRSKLIVFGENEDGPSVSLYTQEVCRTPGNTAEHAVSADHRRLPVGKAAICDVEAPSGGLDADSHGRTARIENRQADEAGTTRVP